MILTNVITLSALVVLVPASSALNAPLENAAATLSKQAACDGLSQIDSNTQSDCDNLNQTDNGVTRIVRAVVKILSWVVGIVAVIMILVAGLKYITSGGDSGKMGSAKSTLVYALVGLFIAALAQFLVTFVLSNS